MVWFLYTLLVKHHEPAQLQPFHATCTSKKLLKIKKQLVKSVEEQGIFRTVCKARARVFKFITYKLRNVNSPTTYL